MWECVVTLVLSAALGDGVEQFLITGKEVRRLSDGRIVLDAHAHLSKLEAEKHIAPMPGHLLLAKPDACMAVEYE